MKRLFVLCAALLFCFFAAGTSSAFAQTEPSGNPDTNVEESSSENKTEDENAADDRDAQNAGSAQSTQTEEDSADIQSDVVYKMNQPGDQFIILKLNVDIPYVPFGKLLVGGSGTLGYQRFIVSGLTLGGDVSFGCSVQAGSFRRVNSSFRCRSASEAHSKIILTAAISALPCIRMRRLFSVTTAHGRSVYMRDCIFCPSGIKTRHITERALFRI